jgi:hypothetical protein
MCSQRIAMSVINRANLPDSPAIHSHLTSEILLHMTVQLRSGDSGLNVYVRNESHIYVQDCLDALYIVYNMHDTNEVIHMCLSPQEVCIDPRCTPPSVHISVPVVRGVKDGEIES